MMSLPYHNIDPVIFNLGPLPIRWYAVSYIVGIVGAWIYGASLLKKIDLWRQPLNGTVASGPPISKEKLDDLIFWLTLGIILGGRFGYVLFYGTDMLFKPWVSVQDMMGGTGFVQTILGWIHIPPALMIWQGGMSFHGGFLGVCVAAYLFTRHHKLNPYSLGDLLACSAPIGLFTVRLANFINGELYGRPSDVPWAMVFPGGGDLARHPSQIYEAILEGAVLFAVLFIAVRRFKILQKPGFAFGIFLSGYGVSRMIVEQFREPDSHLPDFLRDHITMGTILSLPMVMAGIFLIWRAVKLNKPTPPKTEPTK